MPYVEGYAKVKVWVPGPFDRPEPGEPDQGLPGEPDYPSQGLPPSYPGRPGHGLPWPGFPGRPGQGLPRPPWGETDPGWGVEEGAPGQGLPGWPGFPEYPGQPLPRPPRGPYPIVPVGEDIGGHPPLPDLNMPGVWGRVHPPKAVLSFPAFIVYGEPPEVDEDYQPRHPKQGVPGDWATVLYGDGICWAWVPDVTTEGEQPEPPLR